MRRTRSDIILNILNVCLQEANKTRIVYQSNMNFKTVNPYLNALITSGLLMVGEGRGGRRTYKTTDKGIFLKGILEI